MELKELYDLVICVGGCVIPTEGGHVRIKLPAGALPELRDELRRRRSELAAVARRERSKFAADWRRDVTDKKAGRWPGIERWTRASWAIWARSMLGIWGAEELAEVGAEAELRWLRGLAGGKKKLEVA